MNYLLFLRSQKYSLFLWFFGKNKPCLSPFLDPAFTAISKTLFAWSSSELAYPAICTYGLILGTEREGDLDDGLVYIHPHTNPSYNMSSEVSTAQGHWRSTRSWSHCGRNPIFLDGSSMLVYYYAVEWISFNKPSSCNIALISTTGLVILWGASFL